MVGLKAVFIESAEQRERADYIESTVARERKMAWPRGKSRKEYNAEKKAVKETAVHSAETLTVPAASEEGVTVRIQGPRQAPRTSYASMRAAPKRPEWKMKAGNAWDDGLISPDESQDVLRIPREVYPEGIEFMWGTRSIRGQDQKEIRNGYRKARWVEVHDEDFQGSPFWEYSRDKWARDDGGFIVYEACILLANREENVAAMQQADKRRAKEQLQIREQAITGGNMNATGARDPAALNFNKITRTVERLEIPKD